MSGNASVDLIWADGEFRFRLPILQLEELQDKCDAGPAEIYNRICEGRWRLCDLRETIRLGLIGGGMKPTDALLKVRRYVDEPPKMESVPVARAVLLAALIGVPDDPVGKANGEEKSPGNGRLRFSQFYGNGAALGFTPQQVGEMSLWQFAACIEGYNKSQGGEDKPEPMSPDEFEAMLERNAEWLASPSTIQ